MLQSGFQYLFVQLVHHYFHQDYHLGILIHLHQQQKNYLTEAAPNLVVRLIHRVIQRHHLSAQMVAGLTLTSLLDLVHQILPQILTQSQQLEIQDHQKQYDHLQRSVSLCLNNQGLPQSVHFHQIHLHQEDHVHE